jgi:alpha-tubulin suppressor-like RCC1 family protein
VVALAVAAVIAVVIARRRPAGAPGAAVVSGVAVDGVWAGAWHTCARKGGRLHCWGKNNERQLGLDVNTDASIAKQVDGLDGVTAVAAGEMHTCAVRRDGGVLCWGRNKEGQLGSGDLAVAPVPRQVPGLPAIRQIAAGSSHTCALDGNRRVHCWGRNHMGQLGSETPADLRGRADVVSGLDDVTFVAAGLDSTCAVRATGHVVCWGEPQGQYEPGPEHRRARPTAIAGLPAIASLGVGRHMACALDTSGAVHCWGDNSKGQLGTSPAGGERLTPAPVSGLSDVVEIAVRASFACARRQAGTLHCWGRADWGNIGDGLAIGGPAHRDRATQVLDVADATALAVGHQHACAVRRGGGVACWGLNDSSQLGDGSKESRAQPVSVAGL